MNRRWAVLTVCAVVLGLFVSANPALAGGGTKSNGTIAVAVAGLTAGAVNCGVIVDPPPAWSVAPPTAHELVAAGGALAIPGAAAVQFSVRAGDHVVLVIEFDAAGVSTGIFALQPVTVKKRQTVNLVYYAGTLTK